MSKFDLSSVVDKIQKKFEKKNPKKAKKIGIGNNLSKLTEKDYIIMPEWWQKATGTLGIPFGRIVTLAGREDSGKTSAAIQAMKAAQAQNVIIIYVETENKTTEDDLLAWGVDPQQIIIIKETVAEDAFELLFEAWDSVKEKYPEASLLVIIDSIGNVISKRDKDIDLSSESSQPGGKGKINRVAISKMIAKRDEDNVAILLISYTYANTGAPGRTTAGGDALKLFSSLMYQTSRMGWAEKTVKGVKVRVGAKVKWVLTKNHINKSNPGPKEVALLINKDGVSCMGDEEGEE